MIRAATDPVFRADCPSRAIYDQIADKWSVLVLEVLREPRRFNAIKRRLEGMTQRVLTQTLRRLERNGMVTRTVIVGRVLGVEYAITPLGRSLQERLAVLFAWTVDNMDTIQAHHERYDAQDSALITVERAANTRAVEDKFVSA